MTIRYTNFADGEVLTAAQLLDLENNGVVQVSAYTELAALESYVNTAYCLEDHTLYTRKANSSWGSVGGLAHVDITAPSSPQVGQIWFDYTSFKHPIYRIENNSTVSVSATTLTNLASLQVDNYYKENMLVTFNYGAVEAYCSDATTTLTVRPTFTGSAVEYSPYESHKLKATGTNKASINGTATMQVRSVDSNTYVTFKLQAMKSGTGTGTLVCPWIEIIDARWSS
jgi:hypothetical protein